MSKDQQRFEQAIRQFDAIHAADPEQIEVASLSVPRALFHAQEISRWVSTLRPEASEALRLAARCQHLRRWEFPRSTYPLTREGYLQWRKDLSVFHAQGATEVLKSCGYAEAFVADVTRIVMKRGIKTDPEVQTMEDALSLYFLEHQYAQLAKKTAAEKMPRIIRRTWQKMSSQGQQAALGLNLPSEITDLL